MTESAAVHNVYSLMTALICVAAIGSSWPSYPDIPRSCNHSWEISLSIWWYMLGVSYVNLKD